MKKYNKHTLKTNTDNPTVSIAPAGGISLNAAAVAVLTGTTKPDATGMGLEFAKSDNANDWFLRRNDTDGLPVRRKGETPYYMVQSTHLRKAIFESLDLGLDLPSQRFKIIPKPQEIDGQDWFLIITTPIN